jgi:hypothetical protein
VKGIDLQSLPMAGFFPSCYELSGFRNVIFQLYRNFIILLLFFVIVINLYLREICAWDSALIRAARQLMKCMWQC